MTEHTFEADLWIWDARRSDTWTFVTVPRDISEALEDEAAQLGPPGGFGSVKVAVTVGSANWRTSVFPDQDSGGYVLPIKKSVRTSEGLAVGDTARVRLRVVPLPGAAD